MNDNPAEENGNKTIIDQAQKEDDAVEDKPRRRIQDGITSKDPRGKMNLDRRYPDSERRCKKDSDYKGPARRYTIDQRLTSKDRRKKED
jgi:hypothetical protein